LMFNLLCNLIHKGEHGIIIIITTTII